MTEADGERELTAHERMNDDRLAWGLGELAGGATPPDVTARVLARIEQRPAAPPAPSRWLAAAVLLLGIGVVVMAWFWRGSPVAPVDVPAAPQDPEPRRLVPLPVHTGPEFVSARTAGDVAALPRDVSAVELLDLGNDEVSALRRRCPLVRKLRLRGQDFTDDALAEALSLRHLFFLDLSDCPQFTAKVLDAIADATQLQQIQLDGQAWLTAELAERFYKFGIRVYLTTPDHPLREVLADCTVRYENRLRDLQFGPSVNPAPNHWHEVRSTADIEALPDTVTHVDGLNLDDAAVAALRRLSALAHLRLRSGRQTEAGPMTPHTSNDNRRSVTDAGLEGLSAITTLQSLTLAGTVEVRGDGLRHLAGLHGLEELQLLCIDTSDAGLAELPKLPSLRRLVLTRNHGFGSAGMSAIAQCKHVGSLTLSACPQLHSDDYALLSVMTWLHELRIHATDGAWRNDSDRRLDDTEKAVLARAKEAAARRGAGLTDRSLMAFQELRHLQVLELTFGRFTNMGLQGLTGMNALRELNLTGTDELVASGLLYLPPQIRSLDLSYCRALDDSVAQVLRDQFPALTTLRLADVDRLTDVGPIVAIPTLRDLDLSRCAGLAEAAAEQLLTATQLRQLTVYLTPKLPDTVLRLREHGVVVHKAVW
ncbi:MAG: hypothetical protein IPK26_00255 [Planctomycetes bacterium]|nr:hypothetical protein [Planctomycetota bacterium]